MFPHQQRVVDERRERGPLSTQWTTRPPDRRLLGKQEAGKHLPVCSPINLTPPLLPREMQIQIHRYTKTQIKNKVEGNTNPTPPSLPHRTHQHSFFLSTRSICLQRFFSIVQHIYFQSKKKHQKTDVLGSLTSPSNFTRNAVGGPISKKIIFKTCKI